MPLCGFRVEMMERVKPIDEQYEFINNSNLCKCAEACWEEMQESKVMPTLSEEELDEFEVYASTLIYGKLTKEDLVEGISYAKFLMNCGSYAEALHLIVFTLAQLPRTPCEDLFKDRTLGLYWGRLTCELLLDEVESAQETIAAIEQTIVKAESVPAGQVLKSQCWLCHYALYLFASHPNETESWAVNFFRRE